MGPSRRCSIKRYRTEWRTSFFLSPLLYSAVVSGLQKPQFRCCCCRSYHLLRWSCWRRWCSPDDWQASRGSCVRRRSVGLAAASSFRGRRSCSRQRWGRTACGDREWPARWQTEDSRLERTCRRRPSSEERGQKWSDTRRFRQQQSYSGTDHLLLLGQRRGYWSVTDRKYVISPLPVMRSNECIAFWASQIDSQSALMDQSI